MNPSTSQSAIDTFRLLVAFLRGQADYAASVYEPIPDDLHALALEVGQRILAGQGQSSSTVRAIAFLRKNWGDSPSLVHCKRIIDACVEMARPKDDPFDTLVDLLSEPAPSYSVPAPAVSSYENYGTLMDSSEDLPDF